MKFLKDLPTRLLDAPSCFIVIMLSVMFVFVFEWVPKMLYDGVKVAQPTSECVFKDYVPGINADDPFSLKLDCQGTEAKLSDSRIIAGYLKNPGPLSCSITADGKAHCKQRPRP